MLIVGRDRDKITERLIDFASLYEAHAQDTRRFALYLSGDATLADDLVSEAFVRVWTARERVALPTVRGYLFATVRNLFLRHVNRQKRGAPLDDRAIDSRPDPEDRASGQSELRLVLAALKRLPEVDRAAVLMRADQGLAYEEIAVALGVTVTAAKVKVHRARLKLAEARLARPHPVSDGSNNHERHP
jgi:RNA polymerase sigma-70 factor (ECF subfamily)